MNIGYTIAFIVIGYIIWVYATLFHKRCYKEKDLVSFGNYLLSTRRFMKIVNENLTNEVSDADISNWIDEEHKHEKMV